MRAWRWLDRFWVKLSRCAPHFSRTFMRFLLRPSSTWLWPRLRGPKSGPHESARKLWGSPGSIQPKTGLVLLPLVLGGLWLWQGAGGLFPSTRTLTCTLEGTHPMVQAEFQLWREEVLLLRSVWHHPQSRTWTQEVPLKPGRHQAQLLTWTSKEEAPRVHQQFLDVGSQSDLHLRFH